MAEPRPTPPVPTSVSEQAQRFLATPMTLAGRTDPPLDDTEAWLTRIAATDAYLLARYGGIELPVHSVDTTIGGVHTYVLRAHDVADDASTPIYLDIHGGALISGAGEACRMIWHER